MNMEKAVQIALETRQSPNPHWLLFLCFFLFCLLVFLGLLNFFLSMNNTTQTLKVKIDTMIGSQLKAYGLMTTHSLFRSLHDRQLSTVDVSDVKMYALAFPLFIRLEESDVEATIETNRLISYNSDFLDEPERKCCRSSSSPRLYHRESLSNDYEDICSLINIQLLNDLDTKNDQISDLLSDAIKVQV